MVGLYNYIIPKRLKVTYSATKFKASQNLGAGVERVSTAEAAPATSRAVWMAWALKLRQRRRGAFAHLRLKRCGKTPNAAKHGGHQVKVALPVPFQNHTFFY